ncbi:MAG TPA: GNAT family N-acetyltransferase [Burkholderiaceae bacterium]|nr:GNAT family N-acetyltransferase [Burkholderiaceae bacterium]
MVSSSDSEVVVREVRCDEDWATAAHLVGEYARSLATRYCVPDLADELAQLPQRYGPPHGNLVLAFVNGKAAGCCALRPLPDTDHTNACEMKRLYVQPAARQLGLGHALVASITECARLAGYSCMLLDTLSEMEAARALYEEMGFVEIPPYTQSPIPGAHHLKLML